MKKNIYLLLLFIAAPLYANNFSSGWLATGWLASVISDQTSSPSLQQLQQSADLYDCGLEEENRSFCSDIIPYYNTDVTARFELEDGEVSQIELHSPFSNQAYTQLQLNLRKDGYELAKVSIGDQYYDVNEQLKLKSLKQVNRDVVMFINQGSLVSDKVMHWHKALGGKVAADKAVGDKATGDRQDGAQRLAVFESGADGIAITIK